MAQTTIKTGSGFDGEEDLPFNVATFQCVPLPIDSRYDAYDDEDMPTNLMASRSNVPGMTPQELMAAHRSSLAGISNRPDADMHSLTLSRHQVEPEDILQASMGDMPDDEYNEALKSFRFGESTDGE
ncbi:unspecified product [Leptomonas pyrrhocoris]|uniref:Unspecified product n=1 Tax=Leptomonas pyrrhocoris TaxID=157538 RepID=A0A0M9G870_LEPPY|nr:unspecified product [Leptomonas pyrrhocoris]KPA84613.1 unspecified product [Leptomonas pyrrhocoris]|eukprot:XP_015663052.1 unspecified product [Leptomonas pyrrhocoris]